MSCNSDFYDEFLTSLKLNKTNIIAGIIDLDKITEFLLIF